MTVDPGVADDLAKSLQLKASFFRAGRRLVQAL